MKIFTNFTADQIKETEKHIGNCPHDTFQFLKFWKQNENP